VSGPRIPNPKILGFRFLARIRAKPREVLTSPYLSAGPAHSAGPTHFAGPLPPRCFFSGFGANFFRSHKTSKKHLLPERSKILKIQCPGDFGSYFGRFLDPFWRPFFVDFPDRLNLVIFATSIRRKPLFYHFRRLILASEIDQEIMFFHSRFLDFLFLIFFDLFQKLSILGPRSKSDGVKNGTKIRQVVPQISHF
jgi:hypothetical protein